MAAEEIETERLRLRLATRADAPLLFALDEDPEVTQYITGGRSTSVVGIQARLRDCDGYLWLAHGRGDGRFVGWFSVRPSAPGERELGYRLARDRWGRGLGTEGARAVVDRAFADPDVTRVWAQAMAVNVRSRRVMEAIGMRYVRTFHGEWPDVIDGAEQGDVEYEMRRDEWIDRQGVVSAGQSKANAGQTSR